MTARISTIVLLLIAGAVSAAPQFGQQIPIVSSSQDGPNLDGTYQFSYETGDGKTAEERGYQILVGSPDEGSAKEGSYSYTAPDGQKFSLRYIANENGFQPEGAHIPR